jgi:hypothetical protein
MYIVLYVFTYLHIYSNTCWLFVYMHVYSIVCVYLFTYLFKYLLIFFILLCISWSLISVFIFYIVTVYLIPPYKICYSVNSKVVPML